MQVLVFYSIETYLSFDKNLKDLLYALVLNFAVLKLFLYILLWLLFLLFDLSFQEAILDQMLTCLFDIDNFLFFLFLFLDLFEIYHSKKMSYYSQNNILLLLYLIKHLFCFYNLGLYVLFDHT